MSSSVVLLVALVTLTVATPLIPELAGGGFTSRTVYTSGGYGGQPGAVETYTVREYSVPRDRDLYAAPQLPLQYGTVQSPYYTYNQGRPAGQTEGSTLQRRKRQVGLGLGNGQAMSQSQSSAMAGGLGAGMGGMGYPFGFPMMGMFPFMG